LGRSFNQHIDNQELNALVPSRFEAGNELEANPPLCLIETRRHVALCPECRSKVQKYSLLVKRSSIVQPNAAPGVDCPQDIDWHEVAAGLWPELTATQLMMHAALCRHCGPLLRAATRAKCNPAPQQGMHAAMNAPPGRGPARRTRYRLQLWPSIKWLVPAAALIAVAVVWLGTRPAPSPTPLTGVEFAELASRLTGNTLRESLRSTFGRPPNKLSINGLRRILPFFSHCRRRPQPPAKSALITPKERGSYGSAATAPLSSHMRWRLRNRRGRRLRLLPASWWFPILQPKRQEDSSSALQSQFSLCNHRWLQSCDVVRARADIRACFRRRQ
jgi:hypothetical protein